MLVIRFRRIGKKNKVTYRIVVAEHSFAPSGRFAADLGSYNPHSKAVTLNKDEVLVWLNKGAKPSNSVAKLLEREKVKHNSVVVIKKKRSSKKADEKTEKPVTVPTEAPAEDVAAEAPIETPAADLTLEAVAETPAE